MRIKSYVISSLLISLVASLLAGCNTMKSHEKATQAKANKAGFSALDNANFDGTFVAPGTDFSVYKHILVEQLDLENVDIRQPSTKGLKPWALTDADKLFYRTKYTDALINNLVADGAYTTAINSGSDVMLIKARVAQISPLASKDDLKSRPTMVKVYSEGSGNMTIEIALYDSTTNKLLAIISDDRDLGKIWEENNRVTNNRQITIAFDQWLRNLRNELDLLSRK